MKLYRTREGVFIENDAAWYRLIRSDWSSLVVRDDLPSYLSELLGRLKPVDAPGKETYLPPLETGEVWAAGVTYFRSRTARMEESQNAGGGTFYDRVYEADRPELFFKSTPHRAVGSGGKVHIRHDSKWNVPEPELALAVTPGGKLIGYTVGNDMSSRDIEGENPLYLPQAKVYDRSCGLGPGILITDRDLPASTAIRLEIWRNGAVAFDDSISLKEMKRKPRELIDYLYRENSFPNGCILLTGTGIIPPDDFTLAKGDEVRISVDQIGTLVNMVD